MSITQPFPNLVTMIPIFMNGSPVATHYIGLQSNLYYANDVIRNFQVGEIQVSYKNPVPIDLFGYASTTAIGSSTLFDTSFKNIEVRPGSRNIFSASCNLRDIIVCILSIRGIILYLSPMSCQTILECAANELIGTNISDYVHPGDNIHVLRSLKLASTEATLLDVTCRVRKRVSGYVQVNFNGKVVIQKGTRVLVVTIRPVCLSDAALSSFAVNLYDPPLILKLSPQLLILYSSTHLNEKINSSKSLLGSRLFDLFKFYESEKQVLETLGFANEVTARCEISGRTCCVRIIKTDDVRGSTLIAQLFWEYPVQKNINQKQKTGNIYDCISLSSPSSILCEITTLNKKNDLLTNDINLIQGVVGLTVREIDIGRTIK